MADVLPTVIFIMPDYGPCYASDSDGGVFDISDLFNSHPNFEKIKEVEDKLYGLANWIDFGEPDLDPDFPWSEFNAEALALAKEMSMLLGNIGIPIIYREHYNSRGKERPKDIDVSHVLIATD